MIHAHIDNVTDRNVMGYEVGTRAQYDARHGGNPLWVFLDTAVVLYQIHVEDFIRKPTSFKIDSGGNLQTR